MICPKCKGSRMVFERFENTVVLGRCPMCDGLGEIKGTNFQRITESPEKLAEWIFNDRVEQSEWWYPQCGHTVGDVLEWLNQESEE